MIILEFWFILFTIAVIALGIFASEIESFAGGTGTFIIGLVSLQWWFGIPVWQSIVDNPLSVVLYLVIYTIVGAAYTLLWRWPEFLRDNAKVITNDYDRFMKHNIGSSKEDFVASDSYPFPVKKYATHIYTWMLTWPFSLLWELSRKPIRYVYRVVYDSLGDTFGRIGKAVTMRILNK